MDNRAAIFKDQVGNRIIKIRAVVKKAVNEVDPEKLLSLGNPEDEYSDEIEQISGVILQEQGFGAILYKLTPEDVSHIVANVLFLAFETYTKFPAMNSTYAKLGLKIWEGLYS